jgi:hypothetical protein
MTGELTEIGMRKFGMGLIPCTGAPKDISFPFSFALSALLHARL